MAASQTRMQAAVGAHARGLAAALDGLEQDPGVAASVRRMARSLQGLAEVFETLVWEAEAARVVECEDGELENAARLLLSRLQEVTDDAPIGEYNILLVEDNRTLAAALRAYLRVPGYSLRVASTAEAAVEVLQEGGVDLVVLDLILPDRDGRELLVEMRESPRTAKLPVVVLSAQSGPLARAECLALGASEFVEKPAQPEGLRAIVARHLADAAPAEDGHHDPSTGLLNRGGLAEVYAAEAPDSVTVALIDLDGIEAVEDSHGHVAGDEIFMGVAAFLEEALPDDHVVGRWGGNEIAVVAPGESAAATRDRLSVILARLEEEPGATRVSGIAARAGVSPGGGGLGLKEALAGADRALLWVKRFGLGRVATTGDVEQADTASDSSRVFFVEDDRITATLVEHCLGREGFEVHHHVDGAEALEVARTVRADLAILDVKIPGLDGFALLKALRGLPHFRDVPIMMLSSMGSEADVVRGLSAGADDYMLKPFAPSELVARLRRLARAATPFRPDDPGVR